MALLFWTIGVGFIALADSASSEIITETASAADPSSTGGLSSNNNATDDSGHVSGENETNKNSANGSRVWISEYFPLNKGNLWRYAGDDSFFIHLLYTTTRDKTAARAFYRQDRDETIYYVTNHDGLSRYKTRRAGSEICYVPALNVMPATAEIGAGYTRTADIVNCSGNGPLQTFGQTSQTVTPVGFEDISLPSPVRINGRDYSAFTDCLKIDLSLTDAGETDTETIWLARYLGIVKIENRSGVFYLTGADMYYHNGFFGTWKETMYDEAGLVIGTMTLRLTQSGDTVSGGINLDMNDGRAYALIIREGRVIGTTLSGTAGAGVRRLTFSLTQNGYHLSGPYQSNFTGWGVVAAGNSPGNTSGFDDFGHAGCFIDSLTIK